MRRIAIAGRRDAVIDIEFRGTVRFGVSAQTAEVTSYRDSRHRDAGTPAPIRRRSGINSAIEGQIRLRQLVVQICGIRDLPMLDFVADLHEATDPRGMRSPAKVYASFQREPHGYRLRDSFGKRTLVVDAEDGRLISYQRHPDAPFVVECHLCKVQLEDAASKAKPIALKNRLGVGRAAGGARGMKSAAARETQLMLVRPNGRLGGIRYDPLETPVRLRLAWVVVFPGNDEVWIDAADGRVLGGVNHGDGAWQ